MHPHPRPGKVHYFMNGQRALLELKRLLDLWPRCARYDDFLDGIPD